jgi:Na+/H+ antiporter NhaD/arsenite permease-like protein
MHSHKTMRQQRIANSQSPHFSYIWPYPMILLSITPPVWLVAPFVLLLLLIATGPLFFAKIWHSYYKHLAVFIGATVAIYYIGVRHEGVLVIHTFAEYLSFISLLLALFVASGGIYIFADLESKASVNILFLLCGAVLTNIIGTTGASVLLIRPFMRVNRYRLKPYHIVFFIFVISNVGGLLTPIGDPPLFMGFLKGVPFFWTFTHLWPEWLLALFLLSIVFYFFERNNTTLNNADVSEHYSGKIIINGKRNFVWLALIILTVFIDPNSIEGVPYIELHGHKISYIRELLQLLLAFGCYRFANKKALNNNGFDFEPILEVGFLFVGIFLSMMPALQLLGAMGGEGLPQLSTTFIYWGSGIFSSFLDNAPAYVNFFTLTLTMFGFDAQSINDVHAFIAGSDARYLMAVSTASVFFGAMTYIGNGPNFMVKAIAAQNGVKMPSFFAYMLRYSIPVLLPILIIVWMIFYW